MSDQSTPAFFTQLDSFIESIPSSATATAQPSPLLASYRLHYQLDSIDQTAGHQIWQSTINGYRIVEQRWQHHSNGHTLLIAHGYFDHMGLYGRLVRWGLAHGFTVQGFDLPGHGLSSGKAAAIPHFDDYSKVLAHIIERDQLQQQYLIGQSTGCAVILNWRLQQAFSATEANPQIALLAPLVRSKYWGGLRWAYHLLKPFMARVKRHFAASSHDATFNRFLEYDDPLQTRHIPLCWLGAMDQWVKVIKSAPVIPQQPLTIIQGTEDDTVDWSYNLKQIQRCFPQTEIYPVDNAWHNLVNESQAYWDKVAGLLGQWEKCATIETPSLVNK